MASWRRLELSFLVRPLVGWALHHRHRPARPCLDLPQAPQVADCPGGAAAVRLDLRDFPVCLSPLRWCNTSTYDVLYVISPYPRPLLVSPGDGRSPASTLPRHATLPCSMAPLRIPTGALPGRQGFHYMSRTSFVSLCSINVGPPSGLPDMGFLTRPYAYSAIKSPRACTTSPSVVPSRGSSGRSSFPGDDALRGHHSETTGSKISV